MSGTHEKPTLGRRRFLRLSATLGLAGISSKILGLLPSHPIHAQETAMNKTVLSFYCDDTSPYGRPPEAFKTFLDFVSSQGIAGESSVILGIGGALLSRPTSDAQRTYIEQVQRAFDCGIDANMELMTHGGLYDFKEYRVPEDAPHEGLWLHEPAVSVEDYESYFGHILEEGEQIGVKFTGVTWPGCGCEVCTRRYAELRQAGITAVNPNVGRALLNLARQGKFRRRTVPCFIHPDESFSGARLMASDGPYAVYDLIANVGDWLGSYDNTPARVNADYYISADGSAGRIVDLVHAGAPYAVFYAHWQGLNPATGVGWRAFTEVIARVKRFLGDRVTWMRPSDITEQYHAPRAETA
jgi:hypothetical protein